MQTFFIAIFTIAIVSFVYLYPDLALPSMPHKKPTKQNIMIGKKIR
jgi:hypothetical protein